MLTCRVQVHLLWIKFFLSLSLSTPFAIMPGDENTPPAPSNGRRQREADSALQLGPRKKPFVFISPRPAANCELTYGFFNSCVTDPLIGHGRHFGRTVHALCNLKTLITNGLLRRVELADEPEETFTHE